MTGTQFVTTSPAITWYENTPTVSCTTAHWIDPESDVVPVAPVPAAPPQPASAKCWSVAGLVSGNPTASTLTVEPAGTSTPVCVLFTVNSGGTTCDWSDDSVAVGSGVTDGSGVGVGVDVAVGEGSAAIGVAA